MITITKGKAYISFLSKIRLMCDSDHVKPKSFATDEGIEDILQRSLCS